MKFVVSIGVALVVAGCASSRNEALPPACTQGSTAVVKALDKAPGKVLIDDVTPISGCFNRGASADDIQIVAATMLPAAQQLGDKAREGDSGAALKLGYLVGALEKGSKRNGLGSEMRRRIESEAGGLGPARAAYRRGVKAGTARG